MLPSTGRFLQSASRGVYRFAPCRLPIPFVAVTALRLRVPQVWAMLLSPAVSRPAHILHLRRVYFFSENVSRGIFSSGGKNLLWYTFSVTIGDALIYKEYMMTTSQRLSS